MYVHVPTFFFINTLCKVIVQFYNTADKATVWGAKFHISDNSISISENPSVIRSIT